MKRVTVLMDNLVQNVIWVMGAVLALLILVRVVLVSRGRFSTGHSQGISQTCGTRDVQEDCHAVRRSGRSVLAVLADGMGSNQGGSVSSSLAVESVLDVFERDKAFHNPNYFFQKSLRQANRRILDQLEEGTGGASVAIVLIERLTLSYAVVGNVKVAVLRGGELVPITEGHTVNVLAEKKYLEGSLTRQTTIALLQEQRLYNFVGRDEFDIEVFDQPIQLQRGDIVALMTDGVYDTVPYSELEDLMRRGRDCQGKAEAIIRAVDLAPGEKDNASVILIAV